MKKFTKISSKLSLFDTNILVFAHNIASQFHEKSKRLLFSAIEGEINAALTPQNLLEFYSIITNPKRVGKPLSLHDTQFLVNEYITSGAFTLIYPQNATLRKAFRLATRYQIKKAEIFDTFLAATMLDNGVKTIYTDNERHFKIFPEIEVINPFK